MLNLYDNSRFRRLSREGSVEGSHCCTSMAGSAIMILMISVSDPPSRGRPTHTSHELNYSTNAAATHSHYSGEADIPLWTRMQGPLTH